MLKMDTDSSGTITLKELAAVCRVLAQHFEERAALCADPNALLRAMGAVGDEAARSGSLSILQARAAAAGPTPLLRTRATHPCSLTPARFTPARSGRPWTSSAWRWCRAGWCARV